MTASISTEEAYDRFLDHLRVERNLSPRTLSAYAADLARFCAFLVKQRGTPVRCLSGVRPLHVTRWLAMLAREGLAASSQARCLSALRTWFSYAVHEGWIDRTPALDIRGPKLRRPLPRVISRPEIGRLFDESVETHGPDRDPRQLRNRAALELLYASGLRASELCRLKLEQLHFELGVVRPRGKGSRERMVPVGERALNALREYLAHGRQKLLPKATNSPYVFVGRSGKPLSRITLYKIVRRCAIQAGVSGPTSPHSFRHAFATHLLQGGADLRSVQDMLGHANIATTEIYTHVVTDHLRDTLDKHHPLGQG